MPKYTGSVSATSNTSVNTEDSWLELTAASGAEINITRYGVYVETAASDAVVKGRLVRKSAAGSSGTAGTIVKKNASKRNSASTLNIKNGTTAFTTGTITDVGDTFAFNARGYYEWIAKDEGEEFKIAGSGIGGLVISVSSASIVLRADIDWED